MLVHYRTRHSPKSFKKMSSVVGYIVSFIFLIESLVICIGNALTIFVFWNHRFSLRRSSYLLLNLAVSDLMVGVTKPIAMATKSVPYGLFKPKTPTFADNYIGKIFTCLNVLFSCISVICLSVIALERAFALLRPFVHRTTSSNVYFCTIAFTWLAGSFMAVVYALPAFTLLDFIYTAVVLSFFTALCLLTVCATYIVIRFRFQEFKSMRNPSQIMERSVKLSKTLFVVIGVSLLFWLPGTVFYSINQFCSECIPQEVVYVGTALHLANSLVNPIVYSFRMPMFKSTLRRLLKRNQAN